MPNFERSSGNVGIDSISGTIKPIPLFSIQIYRIPENMLPKLRINNTQPFHDVI